MPTEQNQEFKIPKDVFPKSFFWGTATSAHQVEGDTHNQWTVWELEHASMLANMAEKGLADTPRWKEIKPEATRPENYISGYAANHFELYKKDFDVIKAMNLNAFRFSIEWSRIEPQEGAWNLDAIKHYKKYIAELRARNIEPFITLMHWTLPTWFAKKGGFENRANIKYFVRFAEKVMTELGGDVKYVCTLNEPEVFVGYGWIQGAWPPNKRNWLLAAWTYFNLASAHNQTAKALKNINRRLQVGVTKNCAHNYPVNSKWQSRLAAGAFTWISDYSFFNKVEKNMDWLGLNYYFTNPFDGFGIQKTDAPQSDQGWELRPADIEHVITRLSKKYNKPIVITENGLADGKDTHRKWWIEETVAAIARAIQKGSTVTGYMHWSLLDNFEWAYGKWPRFGLIKVDYETFKRTPRKSAVYYANLVKKLRNQ